MIERIIKSLKFVVLFLFGVFLFHVGVNHVGKGFTDFYRVHLHFNETIAELLQDEDFWAMILTASSVQVILIAIHHLYQCFFSNNEMLIDR